jgi:hypothetical protein
MLSLLSPLGALVISLWVTFGCYFVWFAFSAKNIQGITIGDAYVLWKAHKQFSHCKALECVQIVRGKRLVGFKCECGYEYIQKKPILNFVKTVTPMDLTQKVRKSPSSTIIS